MRGIKALAENGTSGWKGIGLDEVFLDSFG